MAIVRRETIVLLPLLFGISMAQLFGFPFPFPFFRGGSGDDGDKPPLMIGGGIFGEFGQIKPNQAGEVRDDYETDYRGEWELVSTNSGVSAMHVQLMPTNKVIMFDATNFGPSKAPLPKGKCRRDPNKGQDDCWAHAVEYDIESAQIRPLKIPTNTWCSSGALDRNGQLVQTGGWNDGGKGVRYLVSCPTCDWVEYSTALSVQRWYSTQHILPNGHMIVIGGRRQFSYEFVPPPGQSNPTMVNYKLPFLRETCDDLKSIMNNLYPFVYLVPDGNLFIFANNRSILLSPTTHQVLHEFPVLPGGSRNYPSSGSSALLPLRLRADGQNNVDAEVIVCGGSWPFSARSAAKGTFIDAVRTCGRLVITKKNAVWHMEDMPSPRSMADLLILPDTNLLMINGAKKGCAGWGYADEPALEPWIYRPRKAKSNRFVVQNPTNIARMYHSSSAVLPDGRILVAGSNTNAGYNFTGVKFPTELRVEKFSPSYLDPRLKLHRPTIDGGNGKRELRYGKTFKVSIFLLELGFNEKMAKVTMLLPPFTTHGYSMNQRMLVLHINNVEKVGPAKYDIECLAPSTAAIAPPGYYLLFVMNRGLPSKGVWVRIQ